ncbi:A24 family peptidase C-terminal domain-containing protein [Methanolapillus millepedarum]|uniref:Peptidase A24 n=1 Tax=Methanolapillus millepedarum TaxID=3028296 RepID=A0AA96ZVH4_9EURY|nr:hypothetical protein MsAc7_09980 [Methanosarcinaceae archaeon Ac7]
MISLPDLNQPFEIKIILCFLFLTAASFQDLKTRAVSDSVWVKLLLCNLPILMFETKTVGLSYAAAIFISGLLMAIISASFFYLKIWGGADAKALICLSVLFPAQPDGLFLDSIPIATLSNSTVFVLTLPVFLFLKNILDFKKRHEKIKPKELPLFLTGYKTDVWNLIKTQTNKKGNKRLNLYPLLIERYDFSSQNPPVTQKVIFSGIDFREEGEQNYVENLRKSIVAGKIDKYGWVTPGVPYLIPISFGFLTTICFGNLFLKITLFLFK